MKKALCIIVITSLLVTLFPTLTYADNPVVQTIYTADPAPMVYNDTFYLYTGHDEDNSKYFTMNDWRCYSSKDMVNWTDHGMVMSYKTFSWAKGDAWAGHCIERNGKFYYYVPLTDKKLNKPVIGVGVSDSPTGPFKDAIGQPLITDNWGNIDPAVFIDDDGQAYLYWGNPNLYYVKLNKDMISYDKTVGIVKVPLTEESFGKRTGNKDRATLYEEAPWLYKRNGLYYLLYAAGGIPEYIAYSTSSSPTGPWTYKGIIMPTQGGSFTNHPGIIDYKGNTYFAYHSGALPKGGGFTRSVCIEQFKFNTDGSFPTINMTKEGLANISNLNPYVKNEAETIAWESGIETEARSKGGMNVYDINDGDYIKVNDVDFGTKGAETFSASVSCAAEGGTIELHLDSLSGKLVGTLPVTSTGGNDIWKTETTNITGATGIHDLFYVFKGGTNGNLFKIDNWNFAEIGTMIDKSKDTTDVNVNKKDESVNTEDKNITTTVSEEISIVYITGVSLNKKTLRLVSGKSKYLYVNVTPSDASNKKLTWKSSNKKVAKVDKNGKITALAAGTTTIKVISEDGNYTAACKVTVRKK